MVYDITTDMTRGIAKRLFIEFGEGFEIYVNPVEQDLEQPCFFIGLDSSSMERVVGNRHLLKNSFRILYFPESLGDNAELNRVAERMYFALDIIPMHDGSARTQGHNWKAVDDVMHYRCEVQDFILVCEDKPLMEELDITITTRTGEA